MHESTHAHLGRPIKKTLQQRSASYITNQITIIIAHKWGGPKMSEQAKKLFKFALYASVAAIPATSAIAAPASQADQGTASAQSASAEQAADRQNAGIPEIIVTARRRDENLQSVPIAVTVVSQQGLKDNNVQKITDLQYLVPSLSATTNAPNEVRLNLRGQGVSGNSGQAGVVLYFNEVPVPNFAGGVGGGVTPAGPGLFFDLESVQVLKGPQGTLFGKNSVGGSILLQSARPKNDFGGQVEVAFGNYNNREIDGAINVPLISDVLLARVAFNAQKRDGYTNLLGTPTYPNGIDADNRDSWSMRASVSFRPTDSIQNDTIYTYSRYNCRCTYGILVATYPNGPAGLDTLLAEQQRLGIRTALPISLDPVANGSSESVSNVTRFDLGGGITLKNILGYYNIKQSLAADQDTTVLTYFDYPQFPLVQDVKQYTEELQLSGKSFSDRLNWIIGGFYLSAPIPKTYEVANQQVFDGRSFSLDRTGTSSKGLYAQATLEILSGLKFTGGLRYSKDKSTNSSRNGSGYCVGDPNACGIGTQVDSVAKSDALTWTAALDYQVAPGTLVYAKIDRGYRPGGYNKRQVGTGAPLPGFGPEFVTEEEVGIKSDWAVGGVRMRTNAALWFQDYSDIQVQALIPGSINTLTQNAGNAKLWGFELEATAQLSDSLQIGATYNHSNLKYTNFIAGVSPATIAQLQANTTSNNPPNKYSINANYRIPFSNDDEAIALKANWSWQDDSGDTSVINDLGIVKSFGLLNLSATWERVAGTPMDITLFGSNVLNKDYISQAVPYYEPPSFGFGGIIYGEPRMYGIRVRYSFGEGR
jgi:iron complex outermembrane recepter protein